MNPPPNMKDGLIAETKKDGKLSIGLVKNGRHIEDITIPGANASLIATQLLSTAKLTQENAGILLKSGLEIVQEWPTLVPSKVGLGPSQIPGHECLMLSFGEAQLGISLDANSLKQLGQAILALSAQGSVQ